MWNPWTECPLIADNVLGVSSAAENALQEIAIDGQINVYLRSAQTEWCTSGLEARRPRS